MKEQPLSIKFLLWCFSSSSLVPLPKLHRGRAEEGDRDPGGPEGEEDQNRDGTENQTSAEGPETVLSTWDRAHSERARARVRERRDVALQVLQRKVHPRTTQLWLCNGAHAVKQRLQWERPARTGQRKKRQGALRPVLSPYEVWEENVFLWQQGQILHHPERLCESVRLRMTFP